MIEVTNEDGKILKLQMRNLIPMVNLELFL